MEKTLNSDILSKMTIKELREYAKEKNIGIPRKIKKGDIITHITNILNDRSRLNKDVLYLIALESNYMDLRNLCKAGGDFKKICESINFWIDKLKKDFNEVLPKDATIKEYKRKYNELYLINANYQETEELCKNNKICDSISFWEKKLKITFPKLKLNDIVYQEYQYLNEHDNEEYMKEHFKEVHYDALKYLKNIWKKQMMK